MGPLRYQSTTGLNRDQIEDLVAHIYHGQKAEEQCGPRWGRKPALGLYRSVVLTLVHLRSNLSQATLADLYGVSQSTVSRIVRRYSPLIGKVLGGCVPPLSEVTRGRVVVVDGTLVPTGNRAGQTGLYAGKKRRHGANIQILSDLDGALLAVSAPLPGSVHDRRAIAASGWESSLASTPTLGDLAYQGTFVVTPSRKPPRRQLSRGSEVTNRHHARLRAPVERAIAHLKNWKILATGYRGRLAELSDIIRTITALEFYRRGWKAL